MSLQLIHLLLREVSLVCGISLEWNRVIRVLRVSLMINIIGPVLPVRILGLIVTHLRSRGIILWNRFQFSLWREHLERSEGRLVSGLHLHLVRIDDPRLLLEVEGVFFSEDACLVDLIWELLLVVGHGTAGIGIFNKAICASGPASWLETSGY